MTNPKTWEDTLSGAKKTVRPGMVYRCPNCDRVTAAFALFEAADGTWKCAPCGVAPVSPTPTGIQWDDVRGVRAVFLQTSDWSQLPDVPLLTQAKWAALRQRARDVTALGTPAKAMAALQALRDQAALL